MAKLEEEQEKYRASEIERLDDEHATVVMEERYLFLIYTDDTIGTFSQKVSSRSSEHQFKSKSSNIIIEFQGEVNTGFLLLSAKKGEIQYPNEEKITVLKNTSGGALSVISADDSIASASIEGDVITVTPKLTNKDGKRVTITVTSEPVGKYKRQMAKYIATIKKGSITIEAEGYEGEFDGQRHPAVSNVTVTPEDAKVEYSLNGGEYQEEIPEIEMIGEYTVTIKAEKEGYGNIELTKTVIVTERKNRIPVFAQDSTITKNWNTSTLTTNFTVTARATDKDKDDTLTYTVYMKPATSADSEYKEVGTSSPTVQGQNATINITQYNGANLGNYTDYNWKVAVSDGKTTEPVEEEKTNINTIRTYCRTYNCTSGNTTKVNCTTCSHAGQVDCTTCGATGHLTTNCTTCHGAGGALGFCPEKLVCEIQYSNSYPNDHCVNHDSCGSQSSGYWLLFKCPVDIDHPRDNAYIDQSGLYQGKLCQKCAEAEALLYENGEQVRSCRGSIRMNCTSCSGTGKATCTDCSGTGKVRCTSCSGRGYNWSYYYCPSHHIASSHWYCEHSNNTNANYHN